MTIKSVFLSYGRGDDEAFVAEMWQYLTDRGIDAWYDRKNLPSRGEAFTNEIARAIEQSDRFILFIGAYSARSQWCQREWKHALAHCIPIIPILICHTFREFPSYIKRKFNPDIFSVNGLEFPPNMRQNAGEKLYNLLTNAENLPLAELRGVPTLQIYMDRPEYITAIKQQMRLNDPTDITDFRTGIVAITSKQATTGVNGIAGIGKTTIASALAQDCNIRRNFQHIIWIRVGNEMRRPDALAFLRAIADQLNSHEEQFKDQYLQEQTAKIRVETLLSDKRVLLILDDVWDRDLLDVFLFNAKGYKLVTTTRNRRLMNENMVEIERLTNEDGVRLMTYYLNPEKPESVKVDEIPELAQIVTTLHGHTLAIKVIATLLKEQGVQDAPAYLQRLQNLENANLFSFLREDEDLDGETARNRDVEKSLTLSYDHLKPDHQKYFRATGIFAPNVGYTIEALSSIWEIPDPLLAKQTAKSLQNVGLLDYDETRNRYNQHPLLRAYALKLLTDAGENEAVFGRYADFYTGRAKEIFDDTPVQHWADKEGEANFGDVFNITSLGDKILLINKENNSISLYKLLEFLYAVTNYVINRLEVKRWIWFEKGLVATNSLHNGNIDKTILQAFEVTFLNNLGIIYRTLGDTKKSLEYFQQALLIYRFLNERWGEATALSNIGMIYSGLGDKNKALKYFDTSLGLHVTTGNKKGEATALNNIGTIYFDLGNYDIALKYFSQSLSISQKIEDKQQEAITLSNIGTIYREKNDINQAIKYFNKSVILQRLIGDKNGEITTLNNLGALYLELRDTNNALQIFEQALLLNIMIDNKLGQAYLLHNIGALHSSLSNLELALDYYIKALSIMRIVDDNGGEALVLRNIAVVYHNKGDLDKAIEYHQHAIQATFTGDSRLPLWQQELIMLRSKQEDINILSDLQREVLQSQPSEFDALIAKLADIYRQAGEEGLREMLKQSNVPDAQIDEIIMVVIAQVAGQGGDDTDDESVDMLPFETIQQWVQNTYAVMKHVPDQLSEWRDQLDGAKSRMAGMGDDYQNEVQFVGALLAVLRGEKPSLPESHPYHEPMRQLVEALG